MKRFLIRYKDVFSVLLTLVILLSPLLVSAAQNGFPGGNGSSGSLNGSSGGLNGSSGGATGGQVTGSRSLDNPLNPLGGGITSVCGLVVALVKAAIAIGIPIAILFIVWAGFKFVLAQGKPDALKEARNNFLHVIIGIGIFLGSSLIASVIVNTLHQLGVQGINTC